MPTPITHLCFALSKRLSLVAGQTGVITVRTETSIHDIRFSAMMGNNSDPLRSPSNYTLAKSVISKLLNLLAVSLIRPTAT